MLKKWIIHTVIIMFLAYFLRGVEVANWFSAALLAVVLGLLNSLVRPILIILTIPLTLISFGLFILVINTFIVMVADFFLPGFHITSFIWAFLFSIGLSIVGSILK